MNRVLLLLLASGVELLAQTDQPVCRTELFSAPVIELRLADAAPAKETAIATKVTAANSFEATHSNEGFSRTASELYARLDREGYLARPEAPSENRLVRLAKSSFEPEVIHWRKVSISSPVITAVKRKNPLCLISLTFLDVRW
jgi:hypothetical protein